MRSLLKTRFRLHRTGSLVRRKESLLAQSSVFLRRRLAFMRFSTALAIGDTSPMINVLTAIMIIINLTQGGFSLLGDSAFSRKLTVSITASSHSPPAAAASVPCPTPLLRSGGPCPCAARPPGSGPCGTRGPRSPARGCPRPPPGRRRSRPRGPCR